MKATIPDHVPGSDVLVEAQVGRARQLHKDDEFQGLYISEQEVDALMAQPIGLPCWAVLPPANADADVRAAIGRLRGQIGARRKASIVIGVKPCLSPVTETTW